MPNDRLPDAGQGTESPDKPVRVFSVIRRAGGMVCFAIALLLTAGWITEPTAPLALRFGLVPLCAAELVLIVRAARRGLVITADRVTSREWLRTVSFDRVAITFVGMAPYEKLTQPGVRQPFVYVPYLVADDVRYDCRTVRGLKSVVRRRTQVLAQVVASPVG